MRLDLRVVERNYEQVAPACGAKNADDLELRGRPRHDEPQDQALSAAEMLAYLHDLTGEQNSAPRPENEYKGSDA